MKKKSVEFKLKAEKQDFVIESIKSSDQACNYARKFYFDDIAIYESMFIILLNKMGNTIGFAKIAQGGVDCCIADCRIITKYAIDSLAAGVILVHNHPSGNLKPSNEDDRLTKQVFECLRLFDIKLVDHIVITENDYYSYADEGKLK